MDVRYSWLVELQAWWGVCLPAAEWVTPLTFEPLVIRLTVFSWRGGSGRVTPHFSCCLCPQSYIVENHPFFVDKR